MHVILVTRFSRVDFTPLGPVCGKVPPLEDPVKSTPVNNSSEVQAEPFLFLLIRLLFPKSTGLRPFLSQQDVLAAGL